MVSETLASAACNARALRSVLESIPTGVPRGVTAGVEIVIGDDRITCRGTDHRIWVQRTLSASTSGSATITVHLSALLATLGSLPLSEARLTVDATGLGVSSGAFSGTIRCVPFDHVDSMEDAPLVVSLPAALCKTALKAAAYFTDDDAVAQYDKSGGLIVAESDAGCEFVGLTPHRMVVCKIGSAEWLYGSNRLRISKYVASWLAQYVGELGDVLLSANESVVQCSGESFRVRGPLVSGEIPKYDRICSAVMDGVSYLTVTAADLLQSVKRASAFDGTIVVSADRGKHAMVSAESADRGKSTELVEIGESTDQSWKTRQRSKAVIAALSHVADDTVRIGFNERRSALVILGAEMTQILMGMRV
jgi:DNA polymerase III sliding clamp (beta) subunit (PCNA family)